MSLAIATLIKRSCSAAVMPLERRSIAARLPFCPLPHLPTLAAPRGRVSFHTTAPSSECTKDASVCEDLIVTLEALTEKQFPSHPFSTSVTIKNARSVLKSFAAMSEAFPYCQAGAYKDLILRIIDTNTKVTSDLEKTFVVGAFLSFDETGGNWLLRTKGIVALPELLNTHLNFHASLLKRDAATIFGEELTPDYCEPTKIYLKALLADLGDIDPVRRCAAMVAFEMHAGQMIEALWSSLVVAYPDIDKESLSYFKTHVGGDDPQEVYHKQLTQKLTSSLVPRERREEFLKQFISCYALHAKWCQEIAKS